MFGKLPAHGDFVTRGLDPLAAAAWDQWLAAEMELARAAHGPAFDDRYEAAPVWRFAHDAQAGALALSVDSVGRRFPLVVAGGGDSAACEDLLYDALGDAWTVDQLHAAAAALPGDAAEPGPAQWWTPGNAAFPERALSGERPFGLIRTMLEPREMA